MKMNIKKERFKQHILKDKLSLLELLQQDVDKIFQSIREREIRKSKNEKIAVFDLDTIFADSKQEHLSPKVSFSYSGTIVYKHPSGQTYRTQSPLGKDTNEYKLMLFLAQNPYRYFTAVDLSDELNKARKQERDPSQERRVRDTIQEIKEKLGINNEHPHDFFVTNNKRFGINCDSEITQ